MADKQKASQVLLRIGLAFVFFYAVYGSLTAPENWIGYFPQFLRQFFPNNLLLSIFSIYELVLGLWLVWGIKIFYPAILTAMTMIGIVLFNLPVLDVTFRDVAIAFAAAALAVSTKK